MAKASVAYFIDVQKKQQLYINMNQNLMTNELVLVVQSTPDLVNVNIVNSLDLVNFSLLTDFL